MSFVIMVLHHDKADNMQVLKYYVMQQQQKSKSRNRMLSLSPYENYHLTAFCKVVSDNRRPSLMSQAMHLEQHSINLIWKKMAKYSLPQKVQGLGKCPSEIKKINKSTA